MDFGTVLVVCRKLFSTGFRASILLKDEQIFEWARCHKGDQIQGQGAAIRPLPFVNSESSQISKMEHATKIVDGQLLEHFRKKLHLRYFTRSEYTFEDAILVPLLLNLNTFSTLTLSCLVVIKGHTYLNKPSTLTL